MKLQFKIKEKTAHDGRVLRKEEVNIRVASYIKDYHGSRKQISTTTGVYVAPVDWDFKHRRVRESFIDDRNSVLGFITTYYREYLKEEEPSKALLKKAVNKAHKRVLTNKEQETINNKTSVVDMIDEFIKMAPTLNNKKGGIGLSHGTIRHYKSFKNLINKWLSSEEMKDRATLTLQNTKKADLNKFFTYCKTEMGYSNQTIGKKMALMKRIFSFAETEMEEEGVYQGIGKSWKKPDCPPPNPEDIIRLTDEEIKRFVELKGLKQSLLNAHRSAIIQMVVGCRVSDLMGVREKGEQLHPPLTLSNFTEESGAYYCSYKTYKTYDDLVVPIADKQAIEIIESDLFSEINPNTYNKHIKTLCRLAGIDAPTEKSVKVSKYKNEKRIMPKWEAFSSHGFRKTALSSLYNNNIPERFIQSVSGHKSQKMLRFYCGRDNKQAEANKLMELIKQ